MRRIPKRRLKKGRPISKRSIVSASGHPGGRCDRALDGSGWPLDELLEGLWISYWMTTGRVNIALQKPLRSPFWLISLITPALCSTNSFLSRPRHTPVTTVPVQPHIHGLPNSLRITRHTKRKRHHGPMEAGFTAERLGTAYGLCPLVHIATTSGVLAKLVYTANSQANRMSVGLNRKSIGVVVLGLIGKALVFLGLWSLKHC